MQPRPTSLKVWSRQRPLVIRMVNNRVESTV